MRVQIPGKLPTLVVDPVRLWLALRNLLDNAVRHGGAATETALLSLAATDQCLCLTLRDFGPGVDAQQLAHLAEPFYRTDHARQRSTGGVGLGLYLSRLVAQAHGGSLVFRNAQPGLEVTLSLPLPRAPQAVRAS